MNLENFAKKFGLPSWAGGLGMFALVLMPMGQQVTETGNESEGGG